MTTYQTQTYRLRQLFSTLAAVTVSNPVLLEGEKWQEKDAVTGLFTGRTKTGKDGVVSGSPPSQVITGTAFNDLPFDPAGAGAGATNLSVASRTPTSLIIASDTGTDADLPIATPFLAGLQSAVDKTKLDNITPASAFRTDSTSTAGVIYFGNAATGTAESIASWTITREAFTTAGVRLPPTKTASGAWTNRASLTYT
jgi:hypothetical protein